MRKSAWNLRPMWRRSPDLPLLTAVVCALLTSAGYAQLIGRDQEIGGERAVPRHLLNGDEHALSLSDLIDAGSKLFTANWTDQDGAGRPLTKGNGQPLTDLARPLIGDRAFNRVSGPDANSCAGCHNAPHAIAGGGGDFATVGFIGAERFDFVTFDRKDLVRTRGSLDEAGRPATLQTVGNQRATTGLFGAGFLEMIARQMSDDLRRMRDTVRRGQSGALVTKGVSFGMLGRRADGTWDISKVEGLPPQSLEGSRTAAGPTLAIRPWRQSGTVASLREFANESFNHHLGIQTTERFGVGTDPDGDRVTNEMTRGDVTAVVAFQATLPVPGRVIPNDRSIESAVLSGEQLFADIRCTACHIPSLPLRRPGWTFTEGRLRIDLTNSLLPQPRLSASPSDPAIVLVPAYTDFKLHDITDPADTAYVEPLDINQPVGSAKYLAGNRRFLTRRLWGAANEPPYFHHGLFTTLREAVVAHSGEALAQRQAFERLPAPDQEALLKFLDTLQVLPPGTKELVVDENYKPKAWPPGK